MKNKKKKEEEEEEVWGYSVSVQQESLHVYYSLTLQ